MDINVIAVEKATVVAIQGRLDALSAPSFDEQIVDILANSTNGLVIDLSELEYISSAGLRSILKLIKLAPTQGKNVVICSLQPSVFSVFKISGFASFLKICDTRAQALELIL